MGLPLRPRNRTSPNAVGMSASVPILLQKSFWGDERKFLETADAFYARRREGPYRFVQNRPRTFVAALKSDAAAEKSKDQLSRDFWGRSIFDFCNCPQRGLLHCSKTDRHSITSSAVTSSVGDISMPSALAVLRLMISSTLVVCWTGALRDGAAADGTSQTNSRHPPNVQLHI